MSSTAVRLRTVPRHVRLISTKKARSTPGRKLPSSQSRTPAPHSDPPRRIEPLPRPSSAQKNENIVAQPTPTSTDRYVTVARALQEADAQHANPLDAPVTIPEDEDGILRRDHPAMSILANSTVIIQRQMEMMNLLIGFEQANKYVIMDPHGNHIGFLAEEDHGMGRSMIRQMAGEHRSFTTHVFDKHQKEVLRFHRPFSFISSRIRVYDPLIGQSREDSYGLVSGVDTGAGQQTQVSSLPLDRMRIIGEAQQEWAPLRRKYNLFLHRPITDATSSQSMVQFSHVDERFLSWDFSLLSHNNQLLGSVNRSFGGLAREMFTETGSYALRMDSAGLAEQGERRSLVSDSSEGKSISPGMTLDQRAVMLATAVSIDFDYFSRRYAGGFMPIPLWIPGAGGEVAGAGAAGAAGAGAGAAGAAGAGAGAVEAGGIGAAGAMTEVGAGAAGRAIGSAGVAEGISGGVAGAGTMAGYEAMQRGRGSQAADDASPMANDPYKQQPPGTDGGSGGSGSQEEDIWGAFEDSSYKGLGSSSPGEGLGGGEGRAGGGDSGGEGGSWLESFFD